MNTTIDGAIGEVGALCTRALRTGALLARDA